ncbi:dephospho-CoA kinase [Carboxylicivirga linearis]|uniref:Dephospho-CoA kinase n=1 Tax=Carboxylicivirga linearis TaxID=1628157 RepID=A0ABS5JYQ6_9BACT|nr:dephospho-CoA kinase [Carboxylicivirga linearis]MBS2100038.1 dephospho-CoA kinase [Carboxylicivirga linearis]
MLKVGLTGGIGSGKSTVAQLLEVLGVPVYYADDRAKQIMNTQIEVVAQIKQLLGEEAYQNKVVNRTFVAQMVFNDKVLLQKLNQIVHPAVKNDFEQWCRFNSNSKIVVQEAAILFENGGFKKFDKMILVTAPVETRINRVMLRDNVSKEKVMERMNNQWTDEQKIELADKIIVNDDKQSVIEQTIELIKEL